MAYRPFILILVLAPSTGCFSPNFADGEIECGAGSVCPDGFGCDIPTNTCRRSGDVDDDVDAAVPTTDASDACPPTYVKPFGSVGGCYRFSGMGSMADWPEAEADCESDAPGAHLVVIDDVNEHFVVHDLTIGAGEVWMGYSDRAVEGTLEWVAAGDFRPENETCFFENGGPNNSGARDCVVQDENTCGDWFMRSCSEKHPYVCEFDGNAPTSTTP